MLQTLSPEFVLVGEYSSNRSVRKLIRSKDENWIALQQAKHFTERLAECITEGEWDKFKDIAEENQEELFKLLMGLRPSSWEPDADMITKNASLFIVVGEGSTHGAFATEEEAKQRIKEIHDNGFFGELTISEEVGHG